MISINLILLLEQNKMKEYKEDKMTQRVVLILIGLLAIDASRLFTIETKKIGGYYLETCPSGRTLVKPEHYEFGDDILADDNGDGILDNKFRVYLLPPNRVSSAGMIQRKQVCFTEEDQQLYLDLLTRME